VVYLFDFLQLYQVRHPFSSTWLQDLQSSRRELFENRTLLE